MKRDENAPANALKAEMGVTVKLNRSLLNRVKSQVQPLAKFNKTFSQRKWIEAAIQEKLEEEECGNLLSKRE